MASSTMTLRLSTWARWYTSTAISAAARLGSCESEGDFMRLAERLGALAAQSLVAVVEPAAPPAGPAALARPLPGIDRASPDPAGARGSFRQNDDHG